MIERAVFDKNREMLLILAKALDFSWATTMSLLFLGAKDHRITAQELRELESEFGRLNVDTSRSVLEFYRSRKNADGVADSDVAPPAGTIDAIRRRRDRENENERNRIRAQAAAAALPMGRGRINRWMRPGLFSKPRTIWATRLPSKYVGA